MVEDHGIVSGDFAKDGVTNFMEEEQASLQYIDTATCSQMVNENTSMFA
jgi:hypothetical protein